MEGNTEIKTISKIANHLQNLQYIQPQLLQNLSLSKEQDLSCYIGLLNVLYNLARQYSNKGKQNTQVIQTQNSSKENIYNDCSDGNILHLRGEILKEYGKFFMKLFHQPAYSFARFDYQSFNSFCNSRGLSQLVRYTRGIYPKIDSTKKKPLHFLSNYKECFGKKELIGNDNWQLSKKILKQFYNEYKTKNEDNQKNIFKLSEYLENKKYKNFHLSANNDYNLEKGIKMFYILITQSYEQLEESIKLFQKQCLDSKFNQQVLDRLKFWFQNYRSFAQDGLKMYLSKTQLPTIPLLSQFKLNNFEDIIIYMIEKLFYQTTKENITLVEQTKADLKQKLKKLSQAVIYDQLIPSTSPQLSEQDENQQQYYKDNNRMLMLSYVYVIHKLLFPQDQANNWLKNQYVNLKSNKNPLYQPFNRVFYNDQQLLSLYQNGQISQFPTFFHYSREISVKILKLLINKYPENLIKYLPNISILQSYQRLDILINSKLIGDVSSININFNNQYIHDESQYQTEGERLLTILLESQKQYKSLIKNQNQDIDVYNIFINDWRQFYNFYRNFNENYLSQFLLKIKASLASKSKPGVKESRNYLIPSDFIHPYQRKDTYYHIINKFVQVFEFDVEKFTKMLEQMDPVLRNSDMIFKNAVEKLKRYVKIIMTSEFKQILTKANRKQFSNLNQLSMESQGYEQKQHFQDRVWKIYAEAYLLLNQYSKKLLMGGKQQKKIQMFTNQPFGKTISGGQKTGLFGKQYQRPQITEIDD